MNTTHIRPPQPDRSTLVTRHQSYRGLKVEQNLLSQFTMYVVELDQFGLFISDSRPDRPAGLKKHPECLISRHFWRHIPNLWDMPEAGGRLHWFPYCCHSQVSRLKAGSPPDPKEGTAIHDPNDVLSRTFQSHPQGWLFFRPGSAVRAPRARGQR